MPPSSTVIVRSAGKGSGGRHSERHARIRSWPASHRQGWRRKGFRYRAKLYTKLHAKEHVARKTHECRSAGGRDRDAQRSRRQARCKRQPRSRGARGPLRRRWPAADTVVEGVLERIARAAMTASGSCSRPRSSRNGAPPGGGGSRRQAALRDPVCDQGLPRSAGHPTTVGCPAFAYMPERTATAVQRLIDAGAIPVGKTNLDQFATGLNGTRSPSARRKRARPAYIAGGSSSGSAVAVATGLVSFALGSDTAGRGACRRSSTISSGSSRAAGWSDGRRLPGMPFDRLSLDFRAQRRRRRGTFSPSSEASIPWIRSRVEKSRPPCRGR